MAIYHALKARQLHKRNQNKPTLVITNDLLDTLYAQQGNYRLARRHTAENRRLEAQLRQQEQEAKVAELQGRYDTKEKERSIQLLQQQNRITQLAALQQRTLRNAALLTAGLLLLAVGVLVNRYRLRQRTVQQLAAQKQVLETRDQEKELLLREKTLLLQEVHHRVKNNLQIVLSLLNTQVNTLHEPAAIEAIRDSQSRVQTMALIHQNLYQSESLARIDMLSYFGELTEAISEAFRQEAARVQLHVSVEPLQLNTHTAVPLGLIVNELVTNALKYAFPPGYPDQRVWVTLGQVEAGRYQLVVADSGVGLPASVVPTKVASLGLRLVAGLAQQMKARLEVAAAPSACFTLTFRELPQTPVAA
ncbi:sensor histidine kinase [Hymenobacter weizhouensis]|uniref:sensor histidine kinase n=1 Tax=Hymenobacter sp. YIM 151500-1 TaxID=2987689 RepID=UPI0039B6FA88